ncbi:unnamed protein product [Penicillium bialowiezense]
MILSSTRKFASLVEGNNEISLDGNSLDIASIFAVARCDVEPTLTKDPNVLAQVERSVEFLSEELLAGNTVYGVTTGFGGSANTRTQDYEALQKGLIQHHNSAVGSPSPRDGTQFHHRSGSTLNDLKSHTMPISTVRAAMLTRCNSLLRGHSSVRIEIINLMIALIARNMTPIVPLRGSISASGDLTPLAYIAGALEGNPGILIQWNKPEGTELLPADKALKKAGLGAVTFGPKEGLGLLNGTAFSCGSASLILFEANQLLLFVQLLTAMGTEGMLDSRLAVDDSPGVEAKLAQDRYACRTAPQWIGPQLENMKLAMQQAVLVTTAMEKTMMAMQMLGKMVFAQCSELINPALSNGLPPNLSADNPNISFALKGVDINMAAYMSELAYLARPVSNYTQSAEMHNQSLNSLAFITSRYAADTVELLSLMTATYIYVICQALDLRSLQLEFVKLARPEVDEVTKLLLQRVNKPGTQKLSDDAILELIWEELMYHWTQASSKDLPERSLAAVVGSLGKVWYLIPESNATNICGECSWKVCVQQWMDEVNDLLVESYARTRKAFFVRTTTKNYLCSSSKKFYAFVREGLGVPMHRGIVDHPTYDSGECAAEKKTIGANITQIYSELRGGGFMEVLMECFDADSE